ncbi:hypothetical protein [Brevundimonas sp.]|uniref:hypothetical protein n=1 Tax=Brevundimonas sp. TaxID=1871086 RepID=UPI001AD3D83A|nr:hypothetical protein [Brevundimonas sp.]MBN9466562.1 hypothetical protein [Brevundimonas sp.]
MKKRHENGLNQLLEKVAYEGLAVVPKWQMALWYDQDRFTVGIRRDVRERWIELASELSWIEEKPLHFVEIKTDIVLMHNPAFYEHDE